MNTIAIYPGSFDPVTLGHLDIISRSVKLFDRLIVAVAESTNKDNTLFSSIERVEMIRQSILENKRLSGILEDKIVVCSFSGLLMRFSEKNEVRTIVRGIRVSSDFEYEFQMACANKRLNPEIETLFLPSAENMHFISARFVKQIARLGGDVSSMTSNVVVRALCEKFFHN